MTAETTGHVVWSPDALRRPAGQVTGAAPEFVPTAPAAIRDVTP